MAKHSVPTVGLFRYTEFKSGPVFLMQALAFAVYVYYHYTAGFLAMLVPLAIMMKVQRAIAGGPQADTVSGAPLKGRLAVVTGANSGIGFQNVMQLASLGAHVVLACRNRERGEAAVARIKKMGGFDGAVAFAPLDVSSRSSVDTFVKGLPAVARKMAVTLPGPPFTADTLELHLLVNNAGMFTPDLCRTADGDDMIIGTNYVGPYALTEALLPAVRRADNNKGGRIVNVVSLGHTWAKLPDCEHSVVAALDSTLPGAPEVYGTAWEAYGLSKLAGLMHARTLARRFAKERAGLPLGCDVGSTLTAVAVHPGGVGTDMFRNLPFPGLLTSLVSLVGKTPSEGSQTTLQCCIGGLAAGTTVDTMPAGTDGTRAIVSGGYYADCRLCELGAWAITRDVAECDALDLWSKKMAAAPPTPGIAYRGLNALEAPLETDPLPEAGNGTASAHTNPSDTEPSVTHQLDTAAAVAEPVPADTEVDGERYPVASEGISSAGADEATPITNETPATEAEAAADEESEKTALEAEIKITATPVEDESVARGAGVVVTEPELDSGAAKQVPVEVDNGGAGAEARQTEDSPVVETEEAGAVEEETAQEEASTGASSEPEAEATESRDAAAEPRPSDTEGDREWDDVDAALTSAR